MQKTGKNVNMEEKLLNMFQRMNSALSSCYWQSSVPLLPLFCEMIPKESHQSSATPSTKPPQNLGVSYQLRYVHGQFFPQLSVAQSSLVWQAGLHGWRQQGNGWSLQQRKFEDQVSCGQICPFSQATGTSSKCLGVLSPPREGVFGQEWTSGGCKYERGMCFTSLKTPTG